MPNKNENMKTFHYIYKIIFLRGFPTGRYYIGKRTFHGVSMDNDKYVGSGKFCKVYFKKYGKVFGETYIKEILEINPSWEINREREKYWVGDLWKDDPLCMNQVPGGVSPKGIQSPMKGKHHTKEAKDKLSKFFKGKKRPKEVVEKCRLAKLGSKLSEKTKLLIGNSNRESRKHPVYQLDVDGNIIEIFTSTHDVERKLGYAHQNINTCCRGKHNTAYGYKWIYEEDYKCQH